ncbi:uroporphyrinogen-III synthase [Peribacillus kribbensis]|uniref:uroporphyrinogen-III synthase n=1 Tax=Peribacillus kribbensis TaxID=356658 RepID=UPI00040AF0AF|nr:uroporphyrinogen-III synthase [Peribacillus kribbensis]
MGQGLLGKRIATGGSRKTEEMKEIIKKQGGIPLLRPLQGTVYPAEKELEQEIRQFVLDRPDWVIVTTGIGLEALVSAAEKLGIKKELLQTLEAAQIACRGYKARAALKKLGFFPAAVDDDGTTNGLIRSMEGNDLAGKKVWVQLHGETAPALTDYLVNQGAEVSYLLPYRHIPPQQEILEKTYREILSGELDAICFTTAVQVRSLFQYARKQGEFGLFIFRLSEETVCAAVGRVTAEALKDEGVGRIIVPGNERMGAMIVELAQYFERTLHT